MTNEEMRESLRLAINNIDTSKIEDNDIPVAKGTVHNWEKRVGTVVRSKDTCEAYVILYGRMVVKDGKHWYYTIFNPTVGGFIEMEDIEFNKKFERI